MKDKVYSYLEDYINGCVDPGTAVLITGPWGCGKTRFVNDYFKFTRKLRKPDEEPDDDKEAKYQKALTASFFGAQSQMELLSQFAVQRHPKLNSRLARIAGGALNIGARVADGMFSGGEALNGKEATGIIEWLSSMEDHVLVFDDLERSSMPLIERLATINRYVEGMGLKVIVIANEDELDEDQDYARWKEKVIGKTLRVHADPGNVLRELAGALSDTALKQCVLDNVDVLSNVLKQLDDINYRSVRSLVFDVQRLVISAPNLRSSSEAMLSILTFSLAVGSLLRAGVILHDEVDLAKATSTLDAASGVQSRDGKLIEFHRRFRAAGAMDPIISPEMMARLWRDGEIDDHYLEQLTSTHHFIVGDDAQPAWRWLLEPGKISVTRYQEQKRKLLKSVNEGKIVDPGVLLRVVDIHIRLMDLGDHLLPEETDLVAWVKNYLQSHDVGANEPGKVDFSEALNASYGYQPRDDVFQASADAIREYLTKKEDHALRRTVNRWIADITQGDLSSLAFSSDEVPGKRPWLHLVNTQTFTLALLSQGCVQDRVVAAFEGRYAADAEGTLEVEWAWLDELKLAIEAVVNALQNPHQNIARKEFSASFAYIDKQLVDSKQRLQRGRDFLARISGEASPQAQE